MNARTSTVVGGLALVTAGVLSIRGAFERWWPACAIGDYDSDGCMPLQDHKFDYLVPMDPWAPVGDAHQWQGAALLVLACGVICLLPSLGRRTPARLALQMGVVIVAGAIAVVGLTTLVATASGIATPSAVRTVAFWLWGGVGVFVFAGVALIDSVLINRMPPPAEFRRTPWVLLSLATPVIFLVFVGPVLTMYGSHDTAPWTEATFGWLLIAAGVTVGWRTKHPTGQTAEREGLDRAESGAARH